MYLLSGLNKYNVYTNIVNRYVLLVEYECAECQLSERKSSEFEVLFDYGIILIVSVYILCMPSMFDPILYVTYITFYNLHNIKNEKVDEIIFKNKGNKENIVSKYGIAR